MAEEWRAAPGYEGHYEVSDLGGFRSVPRWVNSKNNSFALKRGRVMRTHRGKRSGYLQARVSKGGEGKTLLLHRLVCEAFHGPAPEGKNQVAHADGSRDNNRADNLRWTDAKGNAEDRNDHGTAPIGSNAGNATLTEADVLTIRAEYQGKHGDLARLGRRFGVTSTQILHIVRRRQWTHI